MARKRSNTKTNIYLTDILRPLWKTSFWDVWGVTYIIHMTIQNTKTLCDTNIFVAENRIFNPNKCSLFLLFINLFVSRFFRYHPEKLELHCSRNLLVFIRVRGKKIPWKKIPGKKIPWRIGPRKNVLKNYFLSKDNARKFGRLFIFTDWFHHYTHKKMFDVQLTILHEPNWRTLI